MATRAKKSGVPEEYPLLEVLADQALNKGDEEALNALLTLILKNPAFFLKSLRGWEGAQTATAYDALQTALMKFVERARKGLYRGLSGDVRIVIIRLGKNALYSRKGTTRKNALYHPKETLSRAKYKLEDRDRRSPQTQAGASEKGTVERALETLDTRVRRMIELRNEGRRFSEIGRELGIGEKGVARQVERCVTGIIRAIAERNPTKAQSLARKLHKHEHDFIPPNPDEVRTFVYERMPEEPRELITGIHYEGKTLEDFSQALGLRLSKARLKGGYSLLKSHFQVPFPAAFEAMKS